MDEKIFKLSQYLLNSQDKKILVLFSKFFDSEVCFQEQEADKTITELTEIEKMVGNILNEKSHLFNELFSDYFNFALSRSFLILYRDFKLDLNRHSMVTKKLVDYLFDKHISIFNHNSSSIVSLSQKEKESVVENFLFLWRNNELDEEKAELLESAVLSCQSDMLVFLRAHQETNNIEERLTYKKIYEYALTILGKNVLNSVIQLQESFLETKEVNTLSQQDRTYLLQYVPDANELFCSEESEDFSEESCSSDHDDEVSCDSDDSIGQNNNSKLKETGSRFFHEVFEEIAKKYPLQVAVYEDKASYQYKIIREKSESLSSWLLNRALEPETVIGLFFEPSVDYVVALIAVMKAGYTFVPLDPYEGVGVNRLVNIIDLCEPALILTHQRLKNHGFFQYCTNHQKFFISLETVEENVISSQKVQSPKSVRFPSNRRAYVVFSSGTTGVPKGAEITHRGIMPFIDSLRDILKANQEDCVAQYAHIGFDMSLSEFMLPLSIGGAVNIIPLSKRLQYSQLIDLFETKKTSIAILTPTVLRQLSQYKNKFKHLRAILSAGEKGDKDLFNQWRSRGSSLSPRMIINGYGPIECTIGCLMGIISENETNMPIGDRIYGTNIYFLELSDKSKTAAQPLEKIEPKNVFLLHQIELNKNYELAIGGDGVGRGYFKNAELTQQRFIDIIDPSTRDVVPIFRTFDAVKVIKNEKNDYQIIVEKRLDRSIKVYGEMVYPEDIELCIQDYLQKNKLTVETVFVDVSLSQKGHPEITAYIIDKKNLDLELIPILQTICKNLTKTHMPRRWIIVRDLPTNKHGKLDMDILRKNYPPGKMDNYICSQDGLFDFCFNNDETVDSIRDMLEMIWQEVLELEVKFKFKLEDNFEYLGGTSMRFLQLHHALKTRFKVNEAFNFDEIRRALTFGGMIRLIRGKQGMVSHTPITLSKENTADSPPVFLIHTLYGDAENDYRATKFVKRLKKKLAQNKQNRTIYGISAPAYTHHYLDMPSDIENLARLYIDTIKRKQTKGPYFLIGWSAGGLIAYEMARQLEKNGIIASVFMIDTSDPGYRQRMDSKTFSAHLAETNSQLLAQLSILLDLGKEKKMSNTVTEGKLSQFNTKEEKINFLFKELLKESERVCDKINPEVKHKQFIFTAYTLLMAVIHYQIKKKLKYVHLYIAQKSISVRGDRLGWAQEFYREVIINDAEHFTIMKNKDFQNKLISHIVSHLHEVESVLSLDSGGLLKKLSEIYDKLTIENLITGEPGPIENCVDIFLCDHNGKNGTPIKANSQNHLFNENIRQICVLGENGLGKSTLAKLVANQWARLETVKNQFSLVLYAQLRQYPNEILKSSLLSEAIEFIIKDTVDLSVDIANLRDHLEKIEDKILYIFDGYNEIKDKEYSNIRKTIKKIISSKQSYVLLTSTIHQVPKLFRHNHNRDAKVLHIQPWNVAEQFQYVRQCVPKYAELYPTVNHLLSFSGEWLRFVNTPLLFSIFIMTLTKKNNQHNIANRTISLLALLSLCEERYWYQYLKHPQTESHKRPKSVHTLAILRIKCSTEFIFLQQQAHKLLSTQHAISAENWFKSGDILHKKLGEHSTEKDPFEAVVRAGFVLPTSSDKTQYDFFCFLMRNYFYATYLVDQYLHGSQREKESAYQVFMEHCFDPQWITIWAMVMGLLAQTEDPDGLILMEDLLRTMGVDNPNHNVVGTYQYSLWIECLRECQITIPKTAKDFIISQIAKLLYSHINSMYQGCYSFSPHAIVLDLKKNSFLLNEPLIEQVLIKALNENQGRIPPFLLVLELINAMPNLDKNIRSQLINIVINSNQNSLKLTLECSTNNEEFVLECVLSPLINIIKKNTEPDDTWNNFVSFLSQVQKFSKPYSIENGLKIFPWIPATLSEEKIIQLLSKSVSIVNRSYNAAMPDRLLMFYYQKLYKKDSFEVVKVFSLSTYLEAISIIEKSTNIEELLAAQKIILSTYPIHLHQSVKTFFYELEQSSPPYKPERFQKCFKILKLRQKEKINNEDIQFLNKILTEELDKNNWQPENMLYKNLLRGIDFSHYLDSFKLEKLSGESINELFLETPCVFSKVLLIWIKKSYELDELIPLAVRLLSEKNITLSIEENSIKIHEGGKMISFDFCRTKNKAPENLKKFCKDLKNAYENKFSQDQLFIPEEKNKFEKTQKVTQYERIKALEAFSIFNNEAAKKAKLVDDEIEKQTQALKEILEKMNINSSSASSASSGQRY